MAFRLFLYLAETWGEYIKATGQNIWGTKKIVLPVSECYVVFTGERKDKPSVISLFDEFHPCADGMLELKVRVIFGDEVCERPDILQQYIAFSRELDVQVQAKGAHTGGTYSRNRKVQESGYIARIPRDTREEGS